METARGHQENDWKLLGDIVGEKKSKEFSVPLQKTGKTQGGSTVNHAMAGTLDGNSGLNEKNQVRVYSVASAGFSCHFTGSREK